MKQPYNIWLEAYSGVSLVKPEYLFMEIDRFLAEIFFNYYFFPGNIDQRGMRSIDS